MRGAAPDEFVGQERMQVVALLAVLKEEMFSIESEKLSGVLSPADYKEQKGALETVLKRALKKQAV